MMTWAKHNSRGFTLVEVTASSVILCGAVMIVAAIGTRALTGTRLNRRYEMAASLIDKQLALIDYMGIDAFLEVGQTEGDFEDIGYSYHWQVETEYQEIDSLYLVTATVSWIDGNRPYSVSVDAMFDGMSLLDDAGSETAQE